ncbi:hypothetical protein HYV43_01980 [Candidatus Micrarchaeota archaeon]|nr:hypothetical protein [Candidatus Micrarchaeota archaeon]
MAFDILVATVAVLVTVLPGVAAGFALFFGTKFSRLDKAILGAASGIIVVPMLAFLEYMAFGWGLNAALVLANAALVLLGSLAAYYAQAKKFELNLALPALDWASAKKYAPAAFVLLMMAVAFYVRFAPAFTTTFYEFDPYYYMKLTERLVQNGHIAMFTDDSFFPKQQFQHWPPLEHYLTGSWTLLHQMLTGQGYDQDVMILVSGIYPPLVAAFICFAAFVLVREEYNAYLGAAAAATFALMPQLIKKFGAGVTEQQPWAMFLALLFFTVLALALRRKSYRLGALGFVLGAAVMFGSQQFIFPLMVFVAFLVLQSITYFASGSFEKRSLAVFGLTGAGLLFGNMVMAAYQNQQYITFLSGEVYMVLAGLAFSAALYFASGFFKDRLHTGIRRMQALGVVAVLTLIVAALTPIGGIVADTVLGTAKIAATTNNLAKTIAEDGVTSPGLYPATFGVLAPSPLLLLAALVPLLSACVILFSKKHVKWGSATLILGLFLLFFKGIFEGVVRALIGQNTSAQAQILLTFTSNEIFGFLVVSVASTALLYLFLPKEQRTENTLLFVLVLFPVAFIGANKLKYLLHTAFVLALAFPYLLGETQRLIERLNQWFNVFSNSATVRTGALAVLLMVAALATILQAQTVQNSMNELTYSRLPSDWVQTYKWMRSNTPTDTRVLSWWDYGHWTTFLGQRKTVLNPSNLYGGYDQGVARAFVNGKPQDLYEVMAFHNATHVLVDGDLIGKWGALVYLSGTCQKTHSSVCPNQSDIPQVSSPGQSRYEVEHYFEHLQVAGNCPASVLGVPLPRVQSNLGAQYCLTNDRMVYIDGNGQASNVTRKYKLAGRDPIDSIDSDTSYLFATGQNAFVNINPYYEPYGFHNNVFNAAFTQLFFFEQYPGFKLAYRSPNSYVKVFEYTGRPSDAARVLTPTATPAPTAAPAANATGTNATESSNSNVTNASG